MKAKHILTAIALPAMLAACSQDEDLSGALSQKDYSNIPTVEATFTTSVNENAQTRMATDFGWELGDKIGLAWLGDGSVITGDGKAYQNHPLFCSDATNASFETKTMLYVGKYYAYLPYNEDIKTVAKMKFNASDQELATTSASCAKKAIYISPKLTELKATANPGEEAAGLGKNVKLDISRLSNAATVNLTFGNASKFADLKVLGISVDVKASGASVLPASFEYAPTADAGVSNWKDMANNKIIAGADDNFFGNSGSKGPAATYDVGAIVATSKEGLAVTNDKLTTYILTLPATAAADALIVTITTNYGDVVVNLDTKGAGGQGKAIILKDAGDAIAKEISTAKIFTVFGARGSIDVYVDMSELTVPAVVATQAELNAVLKTLVTKGETATTTITVTPTTANADDTAILTDFTFPEGLKCAVTLTADNGNASAGFVFKGNTVINSRMTLGSGAGVDGTMTIKNLVDDKNAPLTTLTTIASQTLTINPGAKLINEGKIDNVTSGTIVISAKSGNIPAAEFVSNTKTATVTGSGTFTNNGKVQWIAGTLPTIAGGTVYANVKTLSELVAASAAFQAASGGATNEVTIDGDLSMGGQYMTLSFAKIKKMTIKGNVTLNMQGTYTVTALNEINVESGSLNFTEGEGSTTFTPVVGCKLVLSKDTELNVAADITLSFGAASSISYEGATVKNAGTIKVGSISGSGTWSGNGYTPAT